MIFYKITMIMIKLNLLKIKLIKNMKKILIIKKNIFYSNNYQTVINKFLYKIHLLISLLLI